MISGDTNRSDRNAALAMRFLGYLFSGGILIISGISLVVRPAPVRGSQPAFVSALLMAFAAWLIVTQFRLWQCRVSGFEYHAGELRFRTFGIARSQVLRISELVKVEPWTVSRTRAPRGYRLRLHSGRRVYLDFSLTNCQELVSQIAVDLQTGASVVPHVGPLPAQ